MLVIREAYASVGGYDEGLQIAPDWAMWLRDWVVTNRDFLLWRGRLGATVADWDRTHRDASILLRGPLLAEARHWQAERAEALSGREVEFIRASRAAQEPFTLMMAPGDRESVNGRAATRFSGPVSP